MFMFCSAHLVPAMIASRRNRAMYSRPKDGRTTAHQMVEMMICTLNLVVVLLRGVAAGEVEAGKSSNACP